MSIKRIILLVLVCLLTGLFILQVNGVPSLLQYAFLPPDIASEQAAEASAAETEETDEETAEPAKEEESKLTLFLKSWEGFLDEQGEAVKSSALTAHLPSADLSTKSGGSAKADLTAIYGQLHTLPASVLLNGRQLYQDEVNEGKQVAVIDEALAIALFRQGNPVNMTFTLQNQTFTVVGVVKHTRAMGERAEYGLMVPLKAFTSQLEWELFLAQLRLTGGSGTRNGTATNLSNWQAGGQAIDLVKEKYRATLPVRVLLCVLGFILALLFVRFASRVSARLIENSRARLTDEYAIRLLPRFIGVGLLILLMFAIGVGAMVFAFSKLLEPVYVFPEWVPAILVEPREIAATFWNNQKMASGLLSLRSRELLFLRAVAGFITALTLLLAWALVVPLHKLFQLVKPDPAEENED